MRGKGIPRVTVGVVGAGFVAHIHGQAHWEVRGVEVVSIRTTPCRPTPPTRRSSPGSTYLSAAAGRRVDLTPLLAD